MTAITLYNSLTKKKELFTPINPPEVGMYSCGPTVYDRVHIGNLRAFITADTLARTLRIIGEYKLKWVMNITDIDDKMIIRASERYSQVDPKVALKKLADEYETAFKDDLEKVGVTLSDIDIQPHATQHIAEMQEMIRELLDHEIAYIADGSVYFSLSRYQTSGKTYGLLTNIEFDGQSRIDDQDQKVGAGDFALWKAAKPGEPSWEFMYHDTNLSGRPGWHIECSAMSTKYLGHEFDIHTGGVDLKFPHHENEIAQNGGVLARYWVHNEFLQVESEKMSKSLGNFQTLDNIKNPLAFRLFALSGHYRSQMDFQAQSLEDAERRLHNLQIWASKVVNNDGPEKNPELETLLQAFDAALADDLNTPNALAIIANIERLNIFGAAGKDALEQIDNLLGLQLLKSAVKITDQALLNLVKEREAARLNADWQKSDLIREQLASRGIGLEDSSNQTIIWQNP
ncbi:cysteine--tRNA ligase [Candidatus Saccharibacteria bacterium]|nr:cysteine--tRNA ligase [Candidatus Saccharibacteria bacterium]